ncbi:hypothetical protein [Sphingomonas sp.]|uniref:hypothetical protein n=1 Tax=Sphingomonas sp. TaxID=28214 RepID=UPI0035C80BCE
MRHHIIPAVAALIGLGVAVGIATVPSDVLNAAVDRGGFSGILPAAASPIGATGRTVIALLAGLLIAALGFVPRGKAMLVARVDGFARRPRAATADGDEAPVVRRADAHPDAPPRRPIRAASDLGDPLPIFGEEDRRSAPLPPPAERSLPDDLDQPLADFDPAAVPLRPMAPPEPVAPLARPAAPSVAASSQAGPVTEPAPPRFAWLAPDEADEPAPAAPVPLAEASPAAVEPATAFDDAPSITPTWAESPEVETAPTLHEIEAAEPVSAPWPRSLQPEPVEIEAPVLQPESPLAEAPAAPHRAAAEPALSPIAAPEPEPINDDSIAGLLARLERGAAQRRIVATALVTSPAPPAATAAAAPPDSEPEPVSLDETLQRLRRLAAG